MTMELEERKIYEEEETTGEDLGTALMMIGALLLFFDCFILLFVTRDFQDGSRFMIIWQITQAAAGVACIIAGYVKKRRLHVKDDA